MTLPGKLKFNKKTFYILVPILYIFTNFFLIISLSIVMFTNNEQKTVPEYLPKTIYNLFSAQPPVLGVSDTNLDSKDSRAQIIDKALDKYKCPMSGQGETIVKYGDKYGVDPYLIYAIAQQESNCGKKIPKNSYNPFGYAVYTGQEKGAEFNSWEHAIEMEAQLLASYHAKGLIEPCQIMLRYTPSSFGKGSPWCKSVNYFINEIRNGRL